MSEDADYKVGRGRPPLHTRFQKGVCPNPKGRPKGSRNLATRVLKRAEEKITVTTGGRKQQMTKLEAALTQVANKAAAGDHKAAGMLFELFREAETSVARAQGQPRSPEERRSSDARLLAVLADRIGAIGDDDN